MLVVTLLFQLGAQLYMLVPLNCIYILYIVFLRLRNVFFIFPSSFLPMYYLGGNYTEFFSMESNFIVCFNIFKPGQNLFNFSLS